jgi:hypothetical protein
MDESVATLPRTFVKLRSLAPWEAPEKNLLAERTDWKVLEMDWSHEPSIVGGRAAEKKRS